MVASSHATLLDFILNLEIFYRPLGFPVKSTFFKIPLIGLILKCSNCIPIDREN